MLFIQEMPNIEVCVWCQELKVVMQRASCLRAMLPSVRRAMLDLTFQKVLCDSA